MVKQLNKGQTTTSSNGAKKQRKKQAKREAKAMLKLETARKDVQKAQQKVAKAQAQLEARRTRLHNLETHSMQGQTNQQVTSHNDSGNHANISTPTNQVASQPPAEGRTDISQDQGQQEQQEQGQEEPAPSMQAASAMPMPTETQEGAASPAQDPADVPTSMETHEEIMASEQEGAGNAEDSDPFDTQTDEASLGAGWSTRRRHSQSSEGEQETLPTEQHGSDVI